MFYNQNSDKKKWARKNEDSNSDDIVKKYVAPSFTAAFFGYQKAKAKDDLKYVEPLSEKEEKKQTAILNRIANKYKHLNINFNNPDEIKEAIDSFENKKNDKMLKELDRAYEASHALKKHKWDKIGEFLLKGIDHFSNIGIAMALGLIGYNAYKDLTKKEKKKR